MDSIPLETLYNIIGYLPKEDILTVGLLCKAFHTCAITVLFKDVNIWIQRQSLHRLLKISQSAHLSKSVQNLTIGFELLETRVPRKDSYLRSLYRQQSDNWYLPHHIRQTLSFDNVGWLVGRWDWTSQRVSAAYEAYKLSAEVQRNMETTGMDAMALAAALANLPNLRSVVIKSDYYHERNFTNLPKDISTIQKKILIAPYNTHTFRSKDTGRLQLQHLIRAVSITRVQITDFAILDSENTMTRAVLQLHTTDLYNARIAFQHIRRFCFKLPQYSKNHHVAIFSEGQLAKLIQSMPNLENLALIVPWSSPYVPWSSVCGTARLVSLSSLDLQGFNFHEYEFRNFLARHTDTLRAVYLFCVQLYSGTFKSLFCNMRETLKLNKLELTGDFHDDGGMFMSYSFHAAVAIERFVTKQSSIYPSNEILRHQRKSSPC